MCNSTLLRVSAAATALSCSVAFAQGTANTYPSRPVSVIVPYAAGGPADRETRFYTDKLTPMLGQTFIIDYKPGAGTVLGSTFVAKAAPDGHTLLIVTGGLTVFPVLYKDLKFDPIKDFAPVSLMSERTAVLLVKPTFPAKNFKDYIAYAKANPGKLNFGTAGLGGITHLAGAWIHSATKTDVTFVHYKGTGPIMPDLMAGRVDATAGALTSALTLVQAGKLRAIAIMGKQHSKLLPGVGTIDEQGIPGYNYSSWLGISTTGGTPAPIVNKLSAALAKIAKMPDVVGPLEEQGSTLIGSTPEFLNNMIINETKRWLEVVKDANIKL